MTRNKVIIGLIILLILVNSCIFVSANGDITVKLNGEPLVFDVQPIIVDGRTLVPLRAIFEALGANVAWEEATQTVFATKDATVVILQIANKNAFVNSEIVPLDVPAQLVQDRTMVPVRIIAESFGLEVNWNEETRAVEIFN